MSLHQHLISFFKPNIFFQKKPLAQASPPTAWRFCAKRQRLRALRGALTLTPEQQLLMPGAARPSFCGIESDEPVALQRWFQVLGGGERWVGVDGRWLGWGLESGKGGGIEGCIGLKAKVIYREQ